MTSPIAPTETLVARERALALGAADAYGTPQQTVALLAGSRAWRAARLAQPDILSSDAAAEAADTTRETINRWIAAGQCIGLKRTVRGYRLPRWQFEPAIARALGTTEGWALLLFLETPHEALDRRTPRAALEQGEFARVIDLAASEGTGER